MSTYLVTNDKLLAVCLWTHFTCGKWRQHMTPLLPPNHPYPLIPDTHLLSLLPYPPLPTLNRSTHPHPFDPSQSPPYLTYCHSDWLCESALTICMFCVCSADELRTYDLICSYIYRLKEWLSSNLICYGQV